MKKHIAIYVYGALIMLAGILLLFSDVSNLPNIRIGIGVPLTVGSVLAFVAAFYRRKKQVEFAYHEMHALARLVYGIAVLVFCNTPEKLILVTAFLFIFYAFSEIIFCNWLLELGRKVLYKIVVLRFLLGLAIGVGAIASMFFSKHTLQGFGVLFILVGANIVFYVSIMKKSDLGYENQGIQCSFSEEYASISNGYFTGI